VLEEVDELSSAADGGLLMTATGGFVASTGWGMKLRFADFEQALVQESRCGCMSVRTNEIAGSDLQARLEFARRSMIGDGPFVDGEQ